VRKAAGENSPGLIPRRLDRSFVSILHDLSMAFPQNT
jgi:hypothetical protein